MGGPLVFLALALMRMDQRRVVVLVHVVARTGSTGRSPARLEWYTPVRVGRVEDNGTMT